MQQIKFNHKEQLENALNLIDFYHKNQKDKAGKDYKFHLNSVKDIVISRMQDKYSKEDINNAIIVALLHDLIEDTDCTIEELKEKINPDNVEAILLLTKPKKLKNFVISDYYKNIKENKIACEVKIADLLHNINIQRLPNISFKDIQQTHNYLKYLTFLLDIKETN